MQQDDGDVSGYSTGFADAIGSSAVESSAGWDTAAHSLGPGSSGVGRPEWGDGILEPLLRPPRQGSVGDDGEPRVLRERIGLRDLGSRAGAMTAWSRASEARSAMTAVRCGSTEMARASRRKTKKKLRDGDRTSSLTDQRLGFF